MSSALQNVQIPNDPDLKDLLDFWKKDVFLNLNSHHLGTVQSFDVTNQTANATINYPKTFFQKNAQGTYSPVQRAYPPLVQCPCIVLGGGSASLTFPIQEGDECLVLFNDRDLSNWFQGGAGSPVASARFHSFSDALILVGLRSLGNVLSNYDSVRAVLRNKDAMVGVNTTQVKIANTVNGALGPSFTAFFTALTAFMSTCEGSSTDPTLVAAATAFVAAMAVPVAPSTTGPIINIEGILE